MPSSNTTSVPTAAAGESSEKASALPSTELTQATSAPSESSTGAPVFAPQPSASTSSPVGLPSERAMTITPPPPPQSHPGSPMKVVEQSSPMQVFEQKSPASSERPQSSPPSQSAPRAHSVDVDVPGIDSTVGNESTWSSHTNPGACKCYRH